MDVYIEPIEPSPELYVVGAGHVGFHLARLAHETGFRVHVIDDREKFANAERFPYAVEVVVDDNFSVPAQDESTTESTSPTSLYGTYGWNSGMTTTSTDPTPDRGAPIGGGGVPCVN